MWCCVVDYRWPQSLSEYNNTLLIISDYVIYLILKTAVASHYIIIYKCSNLITLRLLLFYQMLI